MEVITETERLCLKNVYIKSLHHDDEDSFSLIPLITRNYQKTYSSVSDNLHNR